MYGTFDGAAVDVLGHSDTRMTQRYTLRHVPEATRLATARVEEHLGAPNAPSAATKPTPAARQR